MSRRILSLALTGFLFIILINWSCTKLDTTTIGSDLIPAVDNIHTFADTLPITAIQGVFEGAFQDTTKLSITSTSEYYPIGINDDPLFGKTTATLYLQLKPGFYPYYLGAATDSIKGADIDSVVLCLGFRGVYGDTITQPMKLQVNAVSSASHLEWDSLGTYEKPNLRTINFAPDIDPTPISDEATVDLNAIRTYRKIGKGTDSVINQIRIKLNDAFKSLMVEQDSLPGFAFPHGFSRDSIFRNSFNNGFAISMTSGNALLYTQLNDANTRLEIHYKKRSSGVVVDTSFSSFVFNNGVGGTAAPRRSAVADHIVRDRSTGPPLPTPDPVNGNPDIYLQTSPGTYATLKIPGLTGYSNRIIHRAEIILEQIPNDPITDGYFNAPAYLYVDLVDTVAPNIWKPIYYDLNPSVYYNPDDKSRSFLYYPYTEALDFTYFGGTPQTKVDGAGTRKFYTINISRYVQQMVTKQTTNYELRLFAPKNIIYPQFEDVPTVIPYVNNIAYGRVKVGGGNNPNPNYRMRLRVIYSRLN